MFTKEEQFFLESIKECMSPSNEKRKTAEENIKSWINQTYLQILIACTKFISCEQLDVPSRLYSCYIISLLTKEECYQNWANVQLEIKTTLQNNSLALLGNENAQIRNSACDLVKNVGVISIKDQGWENLIDTLCKATESQEIKFKLSAIKTLGLVWDSLTRDCFSMQEIQSMENTIIRLLLNPTNNNELSLECLKSYQNFISYIKKYDDAEYLQNSLKMLIPYCCTNSNNNINFDEQVAIEAIHTISDVIFKAYDYIQPHFRNFAQFLFILCNGKNENLAIQAYIFFTEFANEEYERSKKNLSNRNYINSIWDILWPTIKNSLDNRPKIEDQDEFTRYKALSSLLYNISLICNEQIINDIFNYMGEKLSEKDNIIGINSAIYAFGSILESKYEDKLASVIPDSIDTMIKLFQKDNDELNRTVSWCFENICKIHSRVILQDTNKLSQFIITICNILKDNKKSNFVKIHLCNAIYHLCMFLINGGYQHLNILSPYLKDLLLVLENLAYEEKSYDIDCNLTRCSFMAIANLLESASENDQIILGFFTNKIYERLTEANNIKNFNNSKEKQFEYQHLLCYCIQSISKNVVTNIAKLTNEQINSFFDLIENMFKTKGSVFEEGLLALAGLINLTPDKNFSFKLIEKLMVYIMYSLDNYQDATNCKYSILSLIDIIRCCEVNFINYLPKLFEIFAKIKQAPDANRDLFSLILVIFSDLFNYVGKSIWNHQDAIFNYMNDILSFCIGNIDKYFSSSINEEDEDYLYNVKLNENLVDLISSITGKINDCPGVKEKFHNYIADIVHNYINVLFKKRDFVPSISFLYSVVGLLGDLIEIYRENVAYFLSNDAISNLIISIDKTDDDTLISAKEHLQNQLYVIKRNNY